MSFNILCLLQLRNVARNHIWEVSVDTTLTSVNLIIKAGVGGEVELPWCLSHGVIIQRFHGWSVVVRTRAVQSEKAVAAYFSSKQLLPFWLCRAAWCSSSRILHQLLFFLYIRTDVESKGWTGYSCDDGWSLNNALTKWRAGQCSRLHRDLTLNTSQQLSQSSRAQSATMEMFAISILLPFLECSLLFFPDINITKEYV